jgi:hypothetical protein
MSAHLFPLEWWLEDAVMAGALSTREAWQIQDEQLQTLEEFVLLPTQLWPVLQRVQLFEMDESEMTRH